jgi:hypothetical protein
MKENFSFEKHSRYTYVIPIIFVIILIVIFFCCNLYQTKNAYYLLSTLIQSEAAILGIVITLTLVAVQITASSYSFSVIQVFKKAPDLWVLIFLYIFAIIMGLALLKITNCRPKSNFEIFICFSYFLGAFCFASLIPYVYRMFYLLNPKTIINILSDEIDDDSLIEKNSQPVADENEEDPLQPIIDIIISSLMKYDTKTSIHGLRTIRNKICYILKKKDFGKSKAKIFSKKAYKKLYEIGKFAIQRGDEYLIMEIITTIKKIGKAPIEDAGKSKSKEFEEVIQEASNQIRYIGIHAVEEGLMQSPFWAVMALRELGELSLSKILSSAAKSAMFSYCRIGKMIMKEGEKATFEKLSLLALKEMGKIAIENGMDVAADIVKCLGELISIAELQMNNEEIQIVIENTIDSFQQLLKVSLKYNFKTPKLRAEKNLRKIIRIVKDRKLDVKNISNAQRFLKSI